MMFVDPYTKQKLNKDENGNLYRMDGKKKFVYINNDGVYDFALYSSEREAYDLKYTEIDFEIPTMNKIKQMWEDDLKPSLKILLDSLGEIQGKKILLLGNGDSLKEFYFLEKGAELVYTDLSLNAAKSIKKTIYQLKQKKIINNNVEVHAVDALYLPFNDESFDLIYGYAFVHHIDNLDLFFSEVYRCLKVGGICRFVDNAYSPIWQFVKLKLLKTLFTYRLRNRFISPEDLRFTLKGGFKKEEILFIMNKIGFKNILFIRSSFFLRLFRRGVGLLFNWNPRIFEKTKPLIKMFKWLDDITSKKDLIKNNQLGLIWGFEK